MPPGGPRGSKEIAYNTAVIWAVGHAIVKDAAAAQQEHDEYVSTTLNNYIQTAPPAVNGYPTIRNFLSRHARRIGQRNGSSSGLGTYDWQVQMGNTLKFIADGINEAESDWEHSFKAKVPH